MLHNVKNVARQSNLKISLDDGEHIKLNESVINELDMDS
jgi:hypothetical protein